MTLDPKQIFLITVALATIVVCHGATCTYGQLVNYLFRPSYSPLERPMEGGEPVTISHQFVLLRINSHTTISAGDKNTQSAMGPNQAEDKVAGSFATVFIDGTTGYTADKNIEVYCPTPEPFNVGDVVECTIEVGSWNYDSTELNLEVFREDGTMSDTYLSDTNEMLRVLNTSSELVQRSFEGGTNPFVNIKYSIFLQKKA